MGVAGGAPRSQRAGTIGVETSGISGSPALGQGHRHGPVGSAELLLAGHEVVVNPLHGAQAVGEKGVAVELGKRVFACRVAFRQQDLLQDESQIVFDEFHGKGMKCMGEAL